MITPNELIAICNFAQGEGALFDPFEYVIEKLPFPATWGASPDALQELDDEQKYLIGSAFMRGLMADKNLSEGTES